MSSSVKTIGPWLILIAMFVVFYQVFSVPPAPGTPAATTVDWGAAVARWFPLVPLFLFTIYVLRARNRYALTVEGVRLLNQGRSMQAMEIFEKYRKAHPKQPIGPFHLGSTRLQLWKLEGALADLQTAQKLAKGKGELKALIPEHLALTLALLGREGEARRALSEVPAGKGDPGRMQLAEAILAARAGDASTARAKLSTFEVKQISGSIGALARTIDACCVERLTGELRHVDRIALFGETGPEELRKAWPELVAFIERAPAS